MGSFALELLLCVLAFGFGYAANQGGTCLVVAAHELHRRQPPKMFVGFLAASAAAGLVAVPIVWTGTLGATLAPSTSINFLLLIGAIAFGLGALINDTCLLGSLARLGDGEMRFLALPLGLTIGILAADHGRFGYDSTWPSLISKPSATGLVTLLAFLVVLVLALVFVSTKSVLRTKPGWSFGASMIGLGITGGLLYALSPAWTFADVIQRALPLRMSPAGEVALTAVISSIAGALTASFRQGNLRLQLPTANGILRSVVGGTLMGIGIALIPGGNDGLILAAVPTLSPGGIVAYLLMTTTIVFGFAARGKLFRSCLSRP
ncbi:TPA: YeeE/YedE family protein [Pseudomonas aeruginosa]|nr:YeeE/YedE family protein [Pseudomonas aeruginosa]MBN0679790.1 YeeE/YedE family protein [Pseudomonas aeruginosa]MBN0695022.1 YeeE/YedE family protein [Pseudomonas aeruginosa]MBN0792407.1 YeeE/YedE family protein [Pseudomonas aeruginosa]MBN0947944.1 YeeE/YedE family protein [Pseudomonas aeruginosa]